MVFIFPPSPHWFWFVQLEVVERNRCVCICRKTESSNCSSIAFDSSGCIWLRPDKAWVYIESDSVELFVHTWCSGTGLLGWALAWWRIPSPIHPHTPTPYPSRTDNPTVVLWGRCCRWRVKGAWGPRLRVLPCVKDKEKDVSGLSPWNAGTDEPA